MKNQEITDSINYAQKLQKAILPSLKELDKELKAGFILFKPKDIVSGDFYWMEKVNETVYFAVADCTGHGVPGALVSIVCSNALDRAVKEFNITDTGQILDKVTDLVISKFEKSGTEVKDEMDIGLCALNWGTKKLQYSGANNPLWMIKKRLGSETFKEKDIFNDTHYFKEFKPNRQPIGKHANKKPFKTITIYLIKGDCLYVFSDGYADQFGGTKGKKFMSRPFKKLLLDLVDLPMNEQQDKLLKVFNSWMGGREQIDDVVVIGVKV